MRKDQLCAYAVISTGQTAIWLPSLSCMYHATIDGQRALCNRGVFLREGITSPDEDRSNSEMTCVNCAELVKRVKAKKSIGAEA